MFYCKWVSPKLHTAICVIKMLLTNQPFNPLFARTRCQSPVRRIMISVFNSLIRPQSKKYPNLDKARGSFHFGSSTEQEDHFHPNLDRARGSFHFGSSTEQEDHFHPNLDRARGSFHFGSSTEQEDHFHPNLDRARGSFNFIRLVPPYE